MILRYGKKECWQENYLSLGNILAKRIKSKILQNINACSNYPQFHSHVYSNHNKSLFLIIPMKVV